VSKQESPSRLVEIGAQQHYDDAELYDYEYRRRRSDVHFYRSIATELCGQGASILELACGSGRVTVGLLREGHHVIGVDNSMQMLLRAKERIGKLGKAKRSRAHLVQGDMRRFATAKRFPLVVMAFNSFEHLYTRVEVAECLRSVRDLLTPDGYFVFDLQLPNLHWLCRDPEKRWAKIKFTHPTTGRKMEYSTNHDYDPISQIVLIRLYYAPVLKDGSTGRTRVVNLSQRKFFPAELEALLDSNGFRVEQRFGDFDREPLDGCAENQVLVARPVTRGR
jgi:SAM-dependent methyltransferase